MRILREDTQAVVIDMQERILPAMADPAGCEEKNVMLISGLRALGIPVTLTQQYTKGLGDSVQSIYDAAGTTSYFDKHTFSAYLDPAFAEHVKSSGRKNIIISGIEAHVCVLQTCIDLKDAGYNPILVLDCISSRKESDMKAGIQRAKQEGITVTTAESVLFELLADSKAPEFKTISNLVK